MSEVDGVEISEKQIYEKNKNANYEKAAFWKFLMYSTKAEVHINSITSLLYWVSLMECFLFAIGFALFISSPSNYGVFWTFITHVIKAILGFLLLNRLPGSHMVIEELKEFENDTIQDIENNILQIYRNLIQNNESRIKPILTWYFIFTIIDIIIDNVIFFYLTQKWADSDYSLQNMIVLVMSVAFFSMYYNFINLIVCNGVYFSLLGSARFNFPPQIRREINLVICGYFKGLKDSLVGGMKNVYVKTKTKLGRNNEQDNRRSDQES